MILVLRPLGPTGTSATVTKEYSSSLASSSLFLLRDANNARPNPPWNTSDGPAPDLLVRFYINPNIHNPNSFLCKFPDLLKGFWSFLLECTIMYCL